MSDHITFLQSIPFFSEFKNQHVAFLLKNSYVKHYKKGEIVHLQGDEANFFYVILHGRIKNFRDTADGGEVIVNILSRGNHFALDAIFASRILPSNSQALEDTALITIPGKFFRSLMEDDGEIGIQILSAMANSINQLELHIEHLTLMSAPQRIGCFLLGMCGEQTEGKITFKLPYDKSLIASSLGMKAETFSRALKTLKQLGIINHRDSIVIDDIATLQNYCCVSCSGVDQTCAFVKQCECYAEGGCKEVSA